MKSLTLKEYERISIGKEEEEAEKWLHTRAIEASIANFGGMGAKKLIKETDIRSIPIIDNADCIKPIKNREQAYKLLNNFQWQD